MLPSGDSQMQGGNSETGVRQESPRKQEKPHTILQVVNKLKVLFCCGQKHTALYDQEEYERGLKAVLKGRFLVKSTHEAIEMLKEQQTLLGSIPVDTMRNNSSKLVNQDMDVAPQEEMNLTAEEHLIRLTSRMEWFPIAYHLADKVALVIFPILGYYTGKYHLNDTMTFLWAMAFMPIFVLSAIWGINELAVYLERRKKKTKSRR